MIKGIQPSRDDMMVTMTVGQLGTLLDAAVQKAVEPLMQRLDDIECAIDKEAYQDVVLVGEAEIAEYLGIAVSTLSRIIKQGKLKGVVRKVGGQYRAKRSALDDADTTT